MCPTGLSNRNRIGGFTLLELMIVLLILGLFSALLSVRIGNIFSGGDLRLASRIIIGEISRLRGQAAHTHREQTLLLNMDQNLLYSFESSPDQGRPSERLLEEPVPGLKATRLPDGVILEDVVIVSRGKVQDGEARIRFFADGSLDRSLIHLRNEKKGVYTLEINPITGQVRLHDRYIDQQMSEE